MCLAVPCKITSINQDMATVSLAGVTRKVSLALVEDVAVGEYVIVHAGFAIQKIHEDAALETLTLLRQTLDQTLDPDSLTK